MSRKNFSIIKFALVACVAGILAIGGCHKREISNLSSTENKSSSGVFDPQGTKSITFYVLPSPPHYKVIDDEEDINKICAAIDEIKKEELFEPKEKGGWKIRLQFSNGIQISLTDANTLKINDKEYAVNNSLQSVLIDIYNNSSAEEIGS